MSVGEFHKPSRRVVNLWRMPAAFADLDTYKMPALEHLSADAQTALLLDACDNLRVPPPSVVVCSGRGLQVKWLFAEPISPSALPSWHAVQRELNRRLQHFGADTKALDAARVLRVVGSYSSRSPDAVRLMHTTNLPTMGGELMPSGVVAYNFSVFVDTLLPLQRSQIEEARRTRAAERAQDAAEMAARLARRTQAVAINDDVFERATNGLRRFDARVLAWDRLDDLRSLARLRGYEGGLPAGERNLFVFMGACFLAQAQVVARDFEGEVRTLAKEFAPAWEDAEVRSCVSSVLSRARDAQAGQKVEFKGRELDPRYRWRNSTLVEVLGISSDEARQLKTILPKSEALRRDADRQCKRRRAQGAQSRTDYLAAAAARRLEAKRLQADGLSMRAIAKTLGVSLGTVNNDLKV